MKILTTRSLSIYRTILTDMSDFNKKKDKDIVQEFEGRKKEAKKIALVCKYISEKGQAIEIEIPKYIFKGEYYWKKRDLRYGFCNHNFDTALYENYDRKLLNGDFCNDRFCPICMPRAAQKRATVMEKAIEIRKRNGTYKYAFLTLTVPNITTEKLPDEIDKLNYSWKKLSLTAKFKECVLGYHISFEFTYNSRTKTWHPHFHIILEYEKGAYQKGTYLKHEEILKMWQKANKDDSIRNVDIREIKGLAKAIFETTKYSVKGSDIITMLSKDNSKINYKDSAYKMLVLDYCIKSKRLHRYGGSLLNAKKLAQAELLAEKELTDEQQKELLLQIAHVEVWGWQSALEKYETLFVMGYDKYKIIVARIIEDKIFFNTHNKLLKLIKEHC